ncbi:GNAT family N-acetyltransferase [Lactobacillus sp. R2/2]|nr:GNAT family N-acetyltransferase [Lactobacillus sp. R2/2]MEB3364422.1 GNAT family N-acetyltransferase [Lactobacillus sp. R2/2]
MHFQKGAVSDYWLASDGVAKRVNFQAIYDQKNFIGLIFWTYAKQIIYIGYLAVDPIWRCQGYGSEILNLMKRNHPGQEIVLDIEPVIKTAKTTLKGSIDYYFINIMASN